MAKGILWAVVLNPDELLSAVPPRFERIDAHHVTLRFGIELGPYEPLAGQTFRARVWSEAWDDEIQAVEVELPEALSRLSDSAHPHVTISREPEVPAKRSGRLLERPAHTRQVALTLELRVEPKPW